MRQIIESIILEEDQFDVRDALPNVVPDPSSLLLKSEYSCPVGKVSPCQETVRPRGLFVFFCGKTLRAVMFATLPAVLFVSSLLLGHTCCCCCSCVTTSS